MIADMHYFIALALFLLPVATHAQEDGSLQGLIAGVLGFIDTVLIPFTLGIAFLVFAMNAIRFFVIGGNNTEGQENARNLTLYGIGAFVLILSLWGLVNILSFGIGLNEGPCIDGQSIQSDYIASNPPCSAVRPQLPPPRVVPTNPGSDPIGAIPSSSAPTIVGAVAYAPVQAVITAARASAANYFQTQITDDFGANAAMIQNTLFADLGSVANPNTTAEDRAEAMYRLVELGAISDTLLANYVTEVNRYNTVIQRPERNLDITAIIATVAAPRALPGSVAQNILTNRQSLINTLNTYNIDADMSPINVTEQINNLFAANVSPATRLAQLRNLANNPQYGITAAQIEDFRTNANAKQIYVGQFDVLE